MMRALYGGRVAIHDGEDELAPGFSIRRVGGHTPGMQIVRVMTKRGWVVVASDAMHFYANRETGIPFAILVDVGEYMAGWQTLNRLADSPDHIIPGHDPRVRAIYPAVKPCASSPQPPQQSSCAGLSRASTCSSAADEPRG
jgi:glyoxylase-like metal-dependent hydrolase (beta-lactamase superfamily II)